MDKRDTKYWVIVASKDHVKKGIAEGIAQACHGKATPFRFGFFEINQHDFDLISSQMLQKQHV